MALDPDIAGFLDLVDLGRLSGKQRAIHEMSVAEARHAFAESAVLLGGAGRPLPRIEDFAVLARDGAVVPVRLYAGCDPAPEQRQPVVLFFHGGGYVVGDLGTHDVLCRDLAYGSGWAVLAVHYRLAPEHKFPTALHDALDVAGWLAQAGAARGLDAGRLVLAGDSVGGSLAAVMAILAVREKAAMPLSPLLQVLIYPVTDAAGTHPSRSRLATGHLLEDASLEWFYHHYQLDPTDRGDWRFSPLHAPDLAGVSPALLLLAEYDPLVDEGLAYAERLRAAGVHVEVDVRPGMTHDYLRMDSVIAEAWAGRQYIARHLANLLHDVEQPDGK
jgi:acetyl esterase